MSSTLPKDRSTAAVDSVASGDSGAHTPASPPNSLSPGIAAKTDPGAASSASTGGGASIPPRPGAPIPTSDDSPPEADEPDDADGGAVDLEAAELARRFEEAKQGRQKAKTELKALRAEHETALADLAKEREGKAALIEVNKSLTAKLATIRRERLTAQVREWIDPGHESMVSTIVDALDAEPDDQRRATLWRDKFGSLKRRGRPTGGAIGGRPGLPMQLRDSPAAKSESPI